MMNFPLGKTLQNQRGALFGVDARIALGIFALMSVIAGFYGYSRLETARDTALVSYLNTLHDGLEAYQTDMATFVPFTLAKASPVGRDVPVLWEKKQVAEGFRRRYNGPYVTRETDIHPDYGTVTLAYKPANRVRQCTPNNACYVWIKLGNVEAEVFDRVNVIVDGDEQEFQRTGRVQTSDAGSVRTLWFRSVRRKG